MVAVRTKGAEMTMRRDDRSHRLRALAGFGRRHAGGVLLGFAVLVIAIGFHLIQSPVGTRGAVGAILMLVLAPALVAGAAVRAGRETSASREAGIGLPEQLVPHPTNPPIECIAADLRRLLRQHDIVLRSADMVMAARHLWALETAITHRAAQAARALEVPHPSPPEHRGLDRPQLRLLLRALAHQGLVIPMTVGLMAPDGRW
jgi:hypothetical protein